MVLRHEKAGWVRPRLIVASAAVAGPQVLARWNVARVCLRLLRVGNSAAPTRARRAERAADFGEQGPKIARSAAQRMVYCVQSIFYCLLHCGFDR